MLNIPEKVEEAEFWPTDRGYQRIRIVHACQRLIFRVLDGPRAVRCKPDAYNCVKFGSKKRQNRILTDSYCNRNNGGTGSLVRVWSDFHVSFDDRILSICWDASTKFLFV